MVYALVILVRNVIILKALLAKHVREYTTGTKEPLAPVVNYLLVVLDKAVILDQLGFLAPFIVAMQKQFVNGDTL